MSLTWATSRHAECLIALCAKENNINKQSLTLNFLFQASYQLLLIIVPLVTTPFLSRVLGASQVGVYSYTYSITNYFVMFAVLGMSTYGVREIASCGKDRKLRSRVFWDMLGCQFLVGALVVSAYVVYAASNPVGGWVIALVWGMWVISALFDISWLYFGVEEFRIPTVRAIATRVAGVALIFLFVRGPEDLWIYCLSISGMYLLNQITLWPFLRRYVDIAKPNILGIKKHLIPNLRLFIPVVAISFYVTLDKIMLGVMTNMTQTGYFEYSEKLSRMPMALITAMGTVMLPRMTAELSLGNSKKALRLLENSIWVMLVMAFAMMFGIIGIAQEFAPVFLGEEFRDCDAIMCVLACIIPIVSITNVLGRQYLLPTGRDSLFTISVCVGAIVNVCCNLVLIPQMAAMGAAISTVCAEFSVLVAQIAITRGELPIARYLKNALPFALFGFIMMGAVRVSAVFFTDLWGVTPLSLALEIVVGVLVFSVLTVIYCVASKNPHALPYLRAVKRKLHLK